VAQLHPQALGSLIFASYNLQGYASMQGVKVKVKVKVTKLVLKEIFLIR
jgi:hypothetical protein